MPLSTEDRLTIEELAQSQAAWSGAIGRRRFLSLVEVAFQTGAISADAAQHLSFERGRSSILTTCLQRRLSGDPRFTFAYLEKHNALVRFMQMALPMFLNRDSDIGRERFHHNLLIENHKRFEFLVSLADLCSTLGARILAESFCQFHEPDLHQELAAAYECLGSLAAIDQPAGHSEVTELRQALDLLSSWSQPEQLMRRILTSASTGSFLEDIQTGRESLVELFDSVRAEVRPGDLRQEELVIGEHEHLDTPERAKFNREDEVEI
jgi:hypothetical protein